MNGCFLLFVGTILKNTLENKLNKLGIISEQVNKIERLTYKVAYLMHIQSLLKKLVSNSGSWRIHF